MIKITNYEIGIVFPLKDEAEANRVACFERPPRKYGVGDEPWVSNTLPDIPRLITNCRFPFFL